MLSCFLFRDVDLYNLLNIFFKRVQGTFSTQCHFWSRQEKTQVRALQSAEGPFERNRDIDVYPCHRCCISRSGGIYANKSDSFPIGKSHSDVCTVYRHNIDMILRNRCINIIFIHIWIIFFVCFRCSARFFSKLPRSMTVDHQMRRKCLAVDPILVAT